MKKVKSKNIQIDNNSTFQEAEIMHTLCAQLINFKYIPVPL
jgi:hypothetical protein